MTIPCSSGILVIGANPKLALRACPVPTQEAELDAMAERIVTVDRFYEGYSKPIFDQGREEYQRGSWVPES
jgi:hypothetical protein